jgi:DNA gyrase subunit B
MTVDTPVAVLDPLTGGDYTKDSVKVLQDAAHIRQRPGMYIGDTGAKGLHHLVYELVYNSVDEALAGYCKHIGVTIKVDGSCSVVDDGRGIPVDIHPHANRPTLEVVLTTVGAGAKFDNAAYKVSAGLHGIGAKAVTSLSEWTEARVRRNGRVYMQEYERGKATTEVKDIGAAPDGKTGTTVTFKPDPQIFHDVTFDYDTLENRLRELAFLNKGLAITLHDERTGKKETFHYEGGIAEFVAYLNRNDEVLHAPIYLDKTIDRIRVEVALQYTTGEEERSRAYANNAFNPGGGTHMSGFRTAITRTLNSYGSKEELFKNDVQPIGEDFREGMTAIVSIQVPDPQFESQTKIRLNNTEVEGIVANVVGDYLAVYLEENPKEAQRIMKKVILAAEAREAATKAKKALKDRKNILSGGGLPGKLMDCTTRDRDASELFLVEGQSAGGSAESGRDRYFQAILPLRGKVLNVEKARAEKLLANEEITNLIAAIGLDIGNNEDLSKVRYGKVVILTDADVDGQHIRTLLLTFFYRQMRKLVEDGIIYVARPPLYAVTQKKQVRYVQTTDEINRDLLTRGLDGTALVLEPGGSRKQEVTLTADRLAQLVKILSDLEDPLVIVERRGLSVATLLSKAKDGVLPQYRVLLGGKEHWLATSDELDQFRQAEQARLGRDLVVDDEAPAEAGTPANGSASANGESAHFAVQELHEVRSLNRGLVRLREFGLSGEDLIPLQRVAGREPPVRYRLAHDDRREALPHLRDLPARIRQLGERGLTVTRFKGLGEMNPDQLWATTLDPKARMLLKVQLEDALKADELFRILMGEKVEPRRDFIQKHALEVKDIDYHGA